MFKVAWRAEPGAGDLMALRAKHAKALEPITAQVTLIGAIEPVFTRHPISLMADAFHAGLSRSDPVLNLALYHHAFVANSGDAEKIAELLKAQGAGTVQIQPPPEPPVRFERGQRRDEPHTLHVNMDLSPTSPDLSLEQGYLEAAPAGIDARWAWGRRGGDGFGVRVVDVEGGWNLQHEDLLQNNGGLIHGINIDNDHGTAVLGIFAGDRNRFGVIGIASAAQALSSGYFTGWSDHRWNIANAIATAADRLSAGDVILVEVHIAGPRANPDDEESQFGYIPAEYWNAEYAAIRYAVAKGIHVVEAAGNGAQDLDDAIYQGWFDRRQVDSGAIMVGGGRPAFDDAPRSRFDWSNFGSRVDVQGWGGGIVTSGGRQKPWYHDRVTSLDESRCYTSSFGGTSGASPIVTGAVAAISGCLKGAGKNQLSPGDMRSLLVSTGTPQEDSPQYPRSENIGPLPNLRAALTSLGLGS